MACCSIARTKTRQDKKEDQICVQADDTFQTLWRAVRLRELQKQDETRQDQTEDQTIVQADDGKSVTTKNEECKYSKCVQLESALDMRDNMVMIQQQQNANA